MEEALIIYKQGCTVPKNVTKVVFDSSVIEVPDNAFRGCANLREVVLNEGLQKIGVNAFLNCKSLIIIKLPSTVTEIGENAFLKCLNLREVVLHGGLQKIGLFAFLRCTLLTVIKLPTTVTEVGACAFGCCINLKEIVLNEGLQEIGIDAFVNCTSLAIIKLPSTVTKVGSRAFANCTNLKEVVLSEGLKCIMNGAFDRCPLEYAKFPAVSKRISNLIEAGYTDTVDKLTIYRHFDWRGGELLVSPEAIVTPEGFDDAQWEITRRNLDQLLAWISYYEIKEATTIIELAMWKTQIEETGAMTSQERSACRGEVPGPAKDAILKYLG